MHILYIPERDIAGPGTWRARKLASLSTAGEPALSGSGLLKEYTGHALIITNATASIIFIIYITKFPLRNISTVLPSAFMPVTFISLVPNMKSSWLSDWFPPAARISSSVMS